jgi:hypothetical protein
MQHRTVHGDACICHSCTSITGTGMPLRQPYGEVCAHPPVEGRRADIAPPGDYPTQIYSAGRPPSAPVIPREARLR